MTTSVKITACCDDNTEVIVELKTKSINKTPHDPLGQRIFESTVLQHGESTEYYVFEDRVVTVREREKSK